MKIMIGNLDRAIREEMFNLHSCFVDNEATEKDFFKRQVEVKTIDLTKIDSEVTKRYLSRMSSDDLMKYYKVTLQEPTKYAVVSGDCLVDGLHRICAKIAAGEKTMKVVDFGRLLDPACSGYQTKIKFMLENKNELTR
ncbi:hypothetical protein [Aquitalea pelogenes]|uniref:hypothetical protein n=1 Tax=Aquitalea pelogenes TaxID=1293573 RepID=UPI0035B4500F